MAGDDFDSPSDTSALRERNPPKKCRKLVRPSVGKMLPDLVVRLVVIALDGRLLDGAVHPFG